PERRVLYGHALRSAAPPFITMILSSLVSSMWGGIISETVWQWPGMGFLYWMAIQSGDVPVLMALSFVGTFLTVAVYLTMDILYGVFDPRVRVGTSGS
ncbi:MAG: ABC transporter permease subunit, partial [Euryarchaeota archaeon]|nr:ABC transporter permease subunit [Euryarchaeota archaeon]